MHVPSVLFSFSFSVEATSGNLCLSFSSVQTCISLFSAKCPPLSESVHLSSCLLVLLPVLSAAAAVVVLLRCSGQLLAAIVVVVVVQPLSLHLGCRSTILLQLFKGEGEREEQKSLDCWLPCGRWQPAQDTSCQWRRSSVGANSTTNSSGSKRQRGFCWLRTVLKHPKKNNTGR